MDKRIWIKITYVSLWMRFKQRISFRFVSFRFSSFRFGSVRFGHFLPIANQLRASSLYVLHGRLCGSRIRITHVTYYLGITRFRRGAVSHVYAFDVLRCNIRVWIFIRWTNGRRNKIFFEKVSIIFVSFDIIYFSRYFLMKIYDKKWKKFLIWILKYFLILKFDKYGNI